MQQLQKISSDSGVYVIESISTGRKYIGSAADVSGRKRNHVYRLKKGTHHSIKLQRHVNKYGLSDLCFGLLEICNVESLIDREQYYIDITEPYFNSCKQAGRTTGYKLTDETRKKLSDSKKGKNHWAWGKEFTEEHKRNISESLKGRKSHFKGKTHTEETKRKISEANTGNPGLVGELNPNFGKPKSKEFKEALSKRMKGQKLFLGKKHTEESKALMSMKRKGMVMPERTDEHTRKIKIANSKIIVQYSLSGEVIAEHIGMKDIAKEIGITWTGISKVVRGKCKTAGGFVWKYKDQQNEN